MKLTPQEKIVVERMACGEMTIQGFLGAVGRSLNEIILADNATVVAMGLTHEQIAGRLQEILAVAMAALGREAPITEDLTAVYHEAMGRIACPWGGCGLLAKGAVQLRDSRLGREIRITPLSVHLVSRHGFYQGRGSPYRLEPAELAELLDIPSAGG